MTTKEQLDICKSGNLIHVYDQIMEGMRQLDG